MLKEFACIREPSEAQLKHVSKVLSDSSASSVSIKTVLPLLCVVKVIVFLNLSPALLLIKKMSLR